MLTPIRSASLLRTTYAAVLLVSSTTLLTTLTGCGVSAQSGGFNVARRESHARYVQRRHLAAAQRRHHRDLDHHDDHEQQRGRRVRGNYYQPPIDDKYYVDATNYEYEIAQSENLMSLYDRDVDNDEFVIPDYSRTTDDNGTDNADEHLYANASTGDDSNDGTTSGKAVRTLVRVLRLVKSNSPASKMGNLVVHLTGTFESQRLVLTPAHRGKSKTQRVIFRGEEDGSTHITGGEALDFVKVTSLPTNHPARKLADLASTPLSNLYAAPPPPSFPDASKDATLRYPDEDCRDFEGYAQPPTLSLSHDRILTRAREPNLPQPTASVEEDGMGEVRDVWLRTNAANKVGKVEFREEDRGSVDLASEESWDGGGVMVHIFPIYDWFDTRVQVGKRSASSFETVTKQKAPGDPCEGNKFKVANEARYYLEGAIEYLDAPGEYHVSLGENVPSSRGWTLMVPPTDVPDLTSVSALLSLSTKSLIHIEGNSMHVTFENIHIEGSRRYLAEVYAYDIDFHKCSFVNAGHDAVEANGQHLTFRNCIFEGSGGSSIQLSDDRDFQSDGGDFLLLESGSAVVDSLLSDFSSTCRHYSEGVHLGGYGTLVSNNHFRSSNMAAIDVVGGGFRILHNVFSHVSDGSYDDGAIHWVSESPMERGTEVGYNVFFRNGVSAEPCNAETSCYQSDVYMDDMAGAMTIHGNVLIKDKVKQVKPPSKKFSVVRWVSLFMNGGADIEVYENAFLGPKDGTSGGAIYKDKGVLFEQSCGGTIWPDGKNCGHTGICSNSRWYKLMTKYGWKEEPWKSAFPELALYEMPDPGSDWRCAARRSCSMAAWNITVMCNGGVGSNRDMSNRAVWPSDPFSPLSDEAAEGKNIPKRALALTERGNKPGSSFNEDEAAIDAIESQGMDAVLALAQRIAIAAQAEAPGCQEGSRNGAARSQLAGRGNNPCTDEWSLDGMASCDSCLGGSINCAPRDLPEDGQCSCGGPTPPTSSPVESPPTADTPAPIGSTSSPVTVTREPTASVCKDGKEKFNNKGKDRSCKWLSKRKKKKQIDKICKKNADAKSICKKTCKVCSDENTDAPTTSPPNDVFTIYQGKGYCDSKKEEQIKGKITNAAVCWKRCKDDHNYKYAELTDETCFCQKKCGCMESADSGTVAIVPSAFKLPSKCSI